MNLLVVSGFWPTASNPITGIFVAQQVSALARAGCQVTIVLPTAIGRGTFRPRSVAEMELDTSRVRLVVAPVLRLPEKLSSLPGAIWFNSELCGGMLSAKIKRLSVDARFDGCIVHGPRYIGLGMPWWRQRIQGKSVVVMHGQDPFLTRGKNLRRAKPLFEATAARTDSFVLVGSPLKGHAHSLGIPDAKIRVIANGTDLPREDQVSARQRPCAERRRVVSVSNLVPLKGIDDNLYALAQVSLKRPDLAWEYRIIGGGSYGKKLEVLAQELNISERVKFLGRLSYSDTMREIDESDIFSLPSWGEAFGIVYLEAMARLKPVIGCLNNGAADIVTDEEDGLLIPPRSISDLAMALERLIENPEICHRIGRRARRTAEKYTWDKNARRMLELLGLERG